MVLPPRNGLSLCAGAGGLDMGLMLAEPDFHTRCFVEWEEYPRQSIIAAQRAGYFAPAPIWDDVKSFDAKPFAGAFDTLLAGYPCQPFSQAGQRKGEEDPRHLWPDIERIIGELGPGLRWCFFENVAGHLSLGLETVLRALHRLGFRTAVGLFSAEEGGAPHERQRVFIVANRSDDGRKERDPCENRISVSYSFRRELADSASGGRGERGDAPLARRCGHPDGGNDELENAERAGAGRREPSADQRGRDTMDGRGASLRRGDGAAGADGTAADGQGDQRELDHTAGARCDAARERPEADERSGQCMSGAGCNVLADARQPGSQGRECARSPGERNRTQAHGPASEFRSAWLFPPGPADRGAWGAILRADPTRAPAFARRDAKAAALDLAALFTPEQAQAIEQRAESMEIGDLLRAVGEEAPGLVDQTAAFTGFRDVAHGLAQRTRALRLLGNGVVPLEAAYAWRSLSSALGLWWVDLGAAEAQGKGEAS